MRTSVGATKAIPVDDRHRRLARHRMIALPNKEIGNPSGDRGAHFRARPVADYQFSLKDQRIVKL
jgi:hypothetical protein